MPRSASCRFRLFSGRRRYIAAGYDIVDMRGAFFKSVACAAAAAALLKAEQAMLARAMLADDVTPLICYGCYGHTSFERHDTLSTYRRLSRHTKAMTLLRQLLLASCDVIRHATPRYADIERRGVGDVAVRR